MKYTKPMSTVSREVKRKAQSTTLTTLMRTSITFLFFSLIATAVYAQDDKNTDNLPDDPLIREAVDGTFPAIVRIEVVSEQGSSGRMLKSRATGSGVIVSEKGHVVTNHHVAGKATRITCRLHDGEEIAADLIGADAMTDLAVIRLRIGERPKDAKPLAVAKFGDSDKVQVGDVCFAMGSPAGLSQSVTRGIISNVAMISPQRGSFRLDGENVGQLVRWLGHDAVIFGGNSGGPLVNEKGEIVGINEVGIGSLGGAIPANLARDVSDELIKTGTVARSWTGLEVQPVLSPDEKGVLIAGIIADSPAEKAGMMPGDVLTHFGGKAVQARIPEDLPLFNQIALSNTVGKKVALKGRRDGKPKKWTILTEVREPAHAKERELKSWGITVRDFTLLSSLEARRADKSGAQVHSVRQGGPANNAKPALLPRDVITKLGDKPVTSMADLIRLTKEITTGKTEAVPTLVTIERNLGHLLTVVKLGPEAEENRPVQAWKPWLGVSTQVLTRDLADAIGLERGALGVRVVQVYPDTPARKGGIEAGDLLLRMDGQIIRANRVEDSEVFGNMIKEYKIDAKVLFSCLRGGDPLDLNVTLARRPTPANELDDFEDETFEFTVRELSFANRVNYRFKKEDKGLLVENVESAGWAALAGLRQGDVLLSIDEKNMIEIEDLETKMTDIVKKKAKRVVFFVKRGIHTLFIRLEPDWDE
jgi:serine protease Do